MRGGEPARKGKPQSNLPKDATYGINYSQFEDRSAPPWDGKPRIWRFPCPEYRKLARVM